MTSYDERLAQRRERLEQRAAKARAESEARSASADSLSQVMNGQPILVGHHSEKRHRSDLNKMWRNMKKSSELYTEAKELERLLVKIAEHISPGPQVEP